MKCGIACLQMVCDHYGKKISEGRLSNLRFAKAEGGPSERDAFLPFPLWLCPAGDILHRYCTGRRQFAATCSAFSHSVYC
jgi:hypothetical protein